jgi:prefoldin subunit 5
MRLNRDVIIEKILAHQSSFMQLLDHIDMHGISLEFPEALFLSLYRNHICLDKDANTQDILSMSSLLTNGIFISHDKNTGMVSIEPAIVNLLRFLDVKRAKKLSRVDFENLRKRVFTTCSDIKNADVDSSDFEDHRQSLNSLLIDIHGIIRLNCEGLEAQVASISATFSDYINQSENINVFELYDKVMALNGRYVLPCNEFMDPVMEIKQSLSFTQSVIQVINYLKDECQLIKEANAVSYRLSAISSFYKDISQLVEKLKQYATRLAGERATFMAIDEAYNSLLESLTPLRHGKKKSYSLTPDMPVFETYTCFDGLAKHKSRFSALLNWDEQKTDKRFKEYLLMIERTESIIHKTPLIPLQYIQDKNETRQFEIAMFMMQHSLPNTIDDIYQYVHELLSTEIDDYWLGDALTGIQEITLAVDDSKMRVSRQAKQINDGQYYLNYQPVSFKENINV